LLLKISAGCDLADIFPLKTRKVGTIGAGFPISRRPLYKAWKEQETRTRTITHPNGKKPALLAEV
jgi:hypothetical protein